MSLLLLSNADT